MKSCTALYQKTWRTLQISVIVIISYNVSYVDVIVVYMQSSIIINNSTVIIISKTCETASLTPSLALNLHKIYISLGKKLLMTYLLLHQVSSFTINTSMYEEGERG